MKLSRSFWLSEFTKSDTAEMHRISNEPTQEHLIALTALANCVMQPLRNHFDKPVTISSGYRSPVLNVKVGGSETSEHSLGAACDFTVEGFSCKEVCEWIVQESGLEWSQLILEKAYDDRGVETKQWVHWSYDRLGGNAKEVMTAYVGPSGSKAEYVQGLH